MKSYRKDKIKLVKDLKEGQNNLCQSLLDINQFQDINHTFQQKKNIFQVEKLEVIIDMYQPKSQEQKHSDMTPMQKLNVYKKQRIKQKYTERADYSNAYQKIFKIRKSKIPNLLNNLSQSMKKQPACFFDQQIKLSQQKLNFYRSQGKLKADLSNKNKINQTTEETRCKFFSLKSGKPEMNQELFPKFQDYVAGKNRNKLQQKFEFDIKKMVRSLNTFYTDLDVDNDKQIESQRYIGQSKLMSQIRKSKISSNPAAISSSVVINSPSLINREKLKKNNNIVNNKFQRILNNSNDFIQKSEKSSKLIIKTMTNFYTSKSSKKSQYNNMLSYYQHDRPLTNQIRRTQYSLGSQKLNQIDYYRQRSQIERKKILQQNSSIYFEILGSLSQYHEDDIPNSLQILSNLRNLMRKDYKLTQNQLVNILRKVKQHLNHAQNPQSQGDFMVQNIIQILNKSFNFTIDWSLL